MLDIKRYAMAGGAVATAAIIGFVMQNGVPFQDRSAAVVPDISGTMDAPLEMNDIKLTSAIAPEQATPPVRAATEAEITSPEPDVSAVMRDAPAPEVQTSETVQLASLDSDQNMANAALDDQTALEPTEVCEISMSAKVATAAMVDLEVDAPCYANERLTIHHNGMMSSHTTDKNGKLAILAPALAENAVFISAFANGEGALASVEVSSLAFYDRKVVQGKAMGGFTIHAFEYGADYFQNGHVHADSKSKMDNAVRGKGGFVSKIGDASLEDALVAEIYTFPSVSAKQAGDINVSVEAEVTAMNCGLSIEAQTLEVHEAGRVKIQDLSLAIPACDAVGDFLVLKDLLEDLKVARN